MAFQKFLEMIINQVNNVLSGIKTVLLNSLVLCSLDFLLMIAVDKLNNVIVNPLFSNKAIINI